MEIGTRIRRLRLRQRRTQQEIADLCGFTKGLLSKIENGRVSPSLATISKVAGALGVRLSALLEEQGGRTASYSPDVFTDGTGFHPTDKGYALLAAASDYTDKKMQPVFVVARKGEVKKHALTHEGEEFLYVIQGEMVFRVGNAEYTLRAGESLYFDAAQPHGLQKVSDETRYLDVMV